jgi:methyl coenzyme M reductase subunit C-like uncharacterized protein (methanogenesis marker protein 7)
VTALVISGRPYLKERRGEKRHRRGKDGKIIRKWRREVKRRRKWSMEEAVNQEAMIKKNIKQQQKIKEYLLSQMPVVTELP